YLWQERRLKQRSVGLLRLGPPSLVTLDDVAARVSAVSLVLFTAGIALGFVRGHPLDLAVAGAVAAWLVFGAALLRPRGVGLRGRGVGGARVRRGLARATRAGLARPTRRVPDARRLRARRVPRTARGASRMKI